MKMSIKKSAVRVWIRREHFDCTWYPQKSIMKVFLVLLLVGCVTASFQDAFEKASNDAVHSFMEGVEQAPPLHLVLGIENSDALQRFERDLKEEMKKHLKEAFEETLKKIDDAVKNGQDINQEAWDLLKDLKDSMNDLDIEDHETDDFKKKVDEHLRQILEQMGILDKRSIEDDPMQSVFQNLSFRNFFIRVKEMILEKMDVTNLKQGFSKAVGQVSQSLCQWITNKGKEKVENFFERFLEAEENTEKRSVSDFYEQIKEYFKDLDNEFQHKFLKFGEWLKNIVDKGLDRSKSKIENIRALAREVLRKSKDMPKEVAAEALEFLRQYKEELGYMYDVVRRRIMEKILENTD